jgi:hypothetical protein
VTRVIYGEGGFTLLDAEMADENPDEHGIEELRLSRLLARAAPGSRSGDGHCNPRGILSHCGGARMDGGDGVTLRYCLDCHGHHASGYSCPQREARRYRISAARKARGRPACLEGGENCGKTARRSALQTVRLEQSTRGSSRHTDQRRRRALRARQPRHAVSELSRSATVAPSSGRPALGPRSQRAAELISVTIRKNVRAIRR